MVFAKYMISTLLLKSCNKKQENEEGVKHKNE